MSADRAMNVAVAVLTACALVTTGLVVRRELYPPPAAASTAAPATSLVPAWREYAGAGHRMGSAAAPVTIVVFSDFQCPYCGVLMERLKSLRAAHPREVSVIYRHFPVEGHEHAEAAARASECAAVQGRFEEFHDALFASRDSIGTTPWDRFAARAGVGDLPRFRGCAGATGRVEALARDSAAARRLNVNGTPTLLINELRLVGAPPLDSLESYVRAASARARS